ncbi:hypothetical protein [Latilactobacillus sakei]|uniref:hypothetical protein n=1 Tax=Latilactobacillus sakei TaxID=1599 RepID=UPI000B5E2F43|nr:hypothetical protein [Latilactobacillus sakei]ASN13626.1 hypothetical protein B4V05_10370 [Latilactobacillus sakei]UTB73254.1 hypothetical protein A4W72_10875 [Latilactobacillus curvatus]
MNKKSLLATILVSTTVLGGLVLPLSKLDAHAATTVNNVSLKANHKLNESIYDNIIKTTTYDADKEQISLELTHQLSDSEGVIIRKDTPSGNSVGAAAYGDNKIEIDYKKIENGHDYYIQYINGTNNNTEIIKNATFTDLVKEKEYLSLNKITADDTKFTGKTLPNSEVAISILADEELVYSTRADSKGDFSVDVKKTLPGRQVIVKTTGKYDSIINSSFIQIGNTPIDNWFYNPDFKDNSKGWFTEGTKQTITSQDGYANFANNWNNSMGAIQNVEGRKYALYTITMDIKINEFIENENKEIYMGSVIPGGGYDPSFSERTSLSEDSLGKWQTVTFSKVYTTDFPTTYLGFTIYGVKNMDVRNVSYERFER